MQSWGVESRFGRRETWDFPTRSGILGLLCCAMGARGPQREWLARMRGSAQTVFSFVSKKENPDIIRTAGHLTDFQMVGSGYDDKDPWENLLIPKTNKGKKAVGGGTKLTYRMYLCDAVFAVILAVPEDLCPGVSEGLVSPCWDICLGRKCCVPSDLVYRGTFESYGEAEAAMQRIVADKELKAVKKVIDGQHPDEGEVFSFNDVPVQFGVHKIYSSRDVTVIDL